jgi:hypothetical protein
LLVERELRVGEELQLHLPVALVASKGLEDRLRREPLVHEERQRRYVEREPLRLADPVEERFPKRLQPLDCILQSGNFDIAERPRLREPVRRIELRGLLYLRKQPFPELARSVLPVPVSAGESEESYRYVFGGFFFLNCACVPMSGRRSASSVGRCRASYAVPGGLGETL